LDKWDLSRCDDLNIFGSHNESFELSSNQSNNITLVNHNTTQDINLTLEDLSLLEKSDNNLNDNPSIETISNDFEDETEKEKVKYYDNFYN
jgi:hypothetical protein